MKQVEFFHWLLTIDGWGHKCKPYRSTYPMTAEQAAKRDPDATPIPLTRQVRELPDDPSVLPASQPYSHGNGGKVPGY